MNQTQIEAVASHKPFDAVFSIDCTVHEHLDDIISKAWTRINFMRKLKFKLDRRSLKTTYFSFIRPVTKLASTDSLYTETIWETLVSRRKKHKLQLLYKMQNALLLSSLVSYNVGNNSAYNLRNARNLTTI